MRLYIIRHGQSTNNALKDIRQRVCDPLLTPRGEQQARVVAEWLPRLTEVKSVEDDGTSHGQSGTGITRLYCSAMWRALQTAEPIGRALGLTPRVWLDIHECGGMYLDHGAEGGLKGYPGATRAEIMSSFPHYELVDGIRDTGWYTGGFEEDAPRLARARRVAEELYRWAGSDEGIAIVSHGDFISILLATLFRLPPDLHLYYDNNNTGVSRIDFEANGRLNVRYLNRIDHLPPELVS